MRFLRTAPTSRLLATILGVIVAIAAGTAIAVAATSSGPVPKARPLARALHNALSAKPPVGLSATLQFTNGLINANDFAAETADPILQGTNTARLWASNAYGLRLELQSNAGNGDANIVVHDGTFWVSDPTSHTVYEGTLPADASGHAATAKRAKAKSAGGVPTVASIQTDLNKLLAHVRIPGMSTANPTDVAGQPAYSVRISPKHDGGLLGAAKVAWDAVTGTPLDVAIYSSVQSGPVLELKATNISFGPQSQSDIDIAPPAGYKVVKVASTAAGGSPSSAAKHGRAKHAELSGVPAVAKKVDFKLAAPRALAGLERRSATLLDWGGKPAALITYGQGLGGLAVIEQSAAGQPAAGQNGSSNGGLTLPTVTVNKEGVTGTQLATALGTVLEYRSGGVAYTVIGSVQPVVADLAAKALTP